MRPPYTTPCGAWGGQETVQEAQKKQPRGPKIHQKYIKNQYTTTTTTTTTTTVKKSMILRIDDWILGDFDTADPSQVVVYLELGLKSRAMRVNDLKINS